MNERALRLNLKHLRYFTEVARKGSVVAAARSLHVAPQTVSAQLRELQDSIGHPLFEKVGRRLVLNGDGEVARDYAMTLFSLADELATVLAGKTQARRRHDARSYASACPTGSRSCRLPRSWSPS